MEHLVQAGKSIEAIQEILNIGDVVYVEPGEYDEVVSLTKPQITYISLEPQKAKTGQWFFESGAHDISIKDFEVTTDNLRGGFILNRANSNNIIAGCHIYNTGDIGIDVTAGSNFNRILNCLIHDSHYAFHISGGGCEGNLFKGNHCYNHSDGINVSPSAIGTKILNNKIHDCIDDGIHLFDDGQAEVIGNLIYKCKGVAFWVNGAMGIISAYNTIIGMPNAKWGYVVWIEKSGHTFKHNIIYVDDANMKMLTGGGKGYIDYNCWYNPQKLLEEFGIHDILKDPRFVDIANDNYQLKSDSPCLNWGYSQNGGSIMWDVAGVDFVATDKRGSIAGRVTKNSLGLEGVVINLSGPMTAEVITGAKGNYKFDNLLAGDYIITPEENSYVFSPKSTHTAIGV